ncbi:type II toxin-antitoxin system Phd/YefM family antitoxin [Nocardia aurantiaca]|uniref:Type II toxin-antitoxin system prevent-host-death family antitoxin n=1 Tax=Nocardia aurantiaca TaxID=2675850 RepID=A0A6I3L6J6_9NOCA|nr:type II toxin-antitoxin system prevent-host-death family antitoxin [Nocardia aurantiaca]MTE16978.1 type II toxin-antitoxin system prevent-host-death family antitoxin [Nocardia aurantiaca]
MSQPERVSVRELRNHVTEVLRRVEGGETLEVTVNERPVALLVPRNERPSTAPSRSFLAELPLADSGLRDQLAEALTETTDETRDPWQV